MANSSNPIRILHLTFNMGIGGTEQVIRQLAMGLSRRDFSNQIVCIDGFVGDIGKQLIEEGIEVTAFERSAGFDRELIRSLRKLIKTSKPDIVHCHQYTPWVYGWLAAKGTGAKIVFTEHGRFHPDRYRYKAALINPVLALTTDAVIAISKATKQALCRYEFVPAPKIKVVYNGIVSLERDETAREKVRAELGIPDNATVLGTVARLDPVKNQTMMLEAFTKVLEDHENTWLLMVGDGPDREHLERKARELQIAHRVKFTGFKPMPVRYLCAMDIFLLSSHTEGTSMTLLEAMSLGMPAVVTSVGGNPEIIEDHETGRLTPTGEVQMFAEAIRYLIEHPDIAGEMGSRSKAAFQSRFSVTEMLTAYSDQYKSLAGKRV